MAQISHPPHLDLNSLTTSVFIPFCAFKTSMMISDPPKRQTNVSFPFCSSFQPTILEGQLCYELQVNTTSGEGKRNQLTLLLDYSEDRSIYASLDQTEDDDSTEINTLDLDGAESLQTKEAKIHINTLSSFKGFGGGTYKMTAAKKISVTDHFLSMPLDDRKCEIESYEVCRTRKLIEKCKCVPFEALGSQVRAQLSMNVLFEKKFQGRGICRPKGWDCVEENANKNFSCMASCEGIYADVQILKEGSAETQEDMEKISRLVNQYNEFKKNILPNFLFNPEKRTSEYSKS